MHQQTPPVEIVAGSVTLRRLRPGDGRPLAQAANESLDHLRPWMSFAAGPKAAMERWVLLCSSRFDAGKGFQYAIFDRSSKMVGSIGIDVGDDRRDSLDSGRTNVLIQRSWNRDDRSSTSDWTLVPA